MSVPMGKILRAAEDTEPLLKKCIRGWKMFPDHVPWIASADSVIEFFKEPKVALALLDVRNLLSLRFLMGAGEHALAVVALAATAYTLEVFLEESTKKAFGNKGLLPRVAHRLLVAARFGKAIRLPANMTSEFKHRQVLPAGHHRIRGLGQPLGMFT